MQLWIHAPKNFRPSNWVEMLRDIDVAFGLDQYLVDPCFVTFDGEKHYVLFVMASLLDEVGGRRQEREALFREMMDRAASLGLMETVPASFSVAYPQWSGWLQSFCQTKRIQLTVAPG